MLSATERTYLRCKVQNASPAGIVIIVFDLLIADVERAIAAIAQGNIEKRCAELKHAFVLLQQLDDLLDRENGGEAAKNFSAFYSAVRAKLLEAHIAVNAEGFRHQIKLLREVREAWQQADNPSPEPAPAAVPGVGTVPAAEGETNGGSWTA